MPEPADPSPAPIDDDKVRPYKLMVAGGVVATAVVILLYTLGAIRDLVFIFVFSVVLAFVFHYPIAFLARFMPRGLAALITAVALLGGMVGLGFMLVPPIREQAQRLIEQAPRALDQLQSWWQDNDGSQTAEVLTALRERLTQDLGRLVSRALPIAFGMLSLVGTAMAVFVLALFLAYSPRVYLNGLVRLVPKQHTKTVVTLSQRLVDSLSGWTLGTLASMAVIGVLTGGGLLIVGIDTWLVLGVLAFFGEFVPFVGPILTAIPGIAMGFAVSPTTGLWVLGIYFVVQQVESQLVQPLVMKRAVKIQPGVLLVWQLSLATAFGFPALLVATPLLAAVQVSVGYLYVHRFLGKPEGEG